MATASTLSHSQVCLSEITPTFTRKAMTTACLKRGGPFFLFVFGARREEKTGGAPLVHAFLPEGDKHHQFDAQELPHGPDGSQLFFQSLVQQHQAVHGELETGEEADGRSSNGTDAREPSTTSQIYCSNAWGRATERLWSEACSECPRKDGESTCALFTSWEMLLTMTR